MNNLETPEPQIQSAPDPQVEIQPTEPSKRSPLRAFFSTTKGKVIIAAVVAIVALVFISKEVYSRPVTDNFVRVAASILPYPAVSVNGSVITLSEYLLEYDALLSSFTATVPDGSLVPSGPELESAILETLINKEAISQLADQHGVDLDEDQAEQYYQDIISSQGTEEDFAEELMETFGWTIKEFKTRIVASIVLALQMTDFVLENEEIQAERLAVIESAHTRLEEGDPFELVAKDTHEIVDPSLESDMGYISLSIIPSSWAVAVTDLENDAYTEVLLLPDGYAIFQAIDRVTNEDDEQVHLLAITVPKMTLEEVVADFLEEANVKRYF